MSAAEGTTTALESATPAINTTAHPASKKKRKVKHLYLARELEAARALGLAVVSMCGRNVAKPMPVHRQNNLEVIGRLMPVTDDRDCKHCVRAYESVLRRDYEAGR